MAKKIPRSRKVSRPCAQPEKPGHHSGGDDLQRERQLERLEEHCSGVRAQAEERRRAEVHIAGVAAQDVPCGCEDDEHQHGVGRKEEVLVLQACGQTSGSEHCDCCGRSRISSPAHLPNSPCGRIPSTISSRPNATAGAQDAPN
jgi:hypothetical protein